ncbi:MAG: hydrogenase iron-sulfur subunit [Anaerolineae bacterium]
MDNESEAKIGIFICDCGSKISEVIDTEKLEKGAADMPGVALAQRELFACSKAGLHDIKEAIAEYGLNRIVVAGCTPRTHERLFKAALEEAGLNGSQFELANIREQCASVHSDDGVQATRKALDLTRMGVAKAALLEPRETVQVEVTPAVLVIGGGIAGLSAALAVAKGGFPVKLVEKEKQLGGQVARLHALYATDEGAREFIAKRIRAVKEHEGVEILTSARVTEVGGSVGDYQITVERDGQTSQFGVGAIVVAIGAQEAKAGGVFGYDGVRVITQLELEQALQEERVDARQVVIIVDGVEEAYYSSASAAAALRNSILLKKGDPGAEVSLLFRDLSSDLSSQKIKEARELGVRFLRHAGREPPQVTDDTVEVFDQLRAERVTIPYDLVVLAMPFVPQDDASSVSRMLRLPLDNYGFFLEPNVRLRPGTYVPDGIYVCGCAHYPADVNESIFQGYRAAARVSRYLSAGRIVSEGLAARVIESLCVGCGTCVESCPFHAIAMMPREGALSVSSIDAPLCKGCGNCTVVCPAKAIVMEPYTDKELVAQINAALADRSDGQPRILGVMCEWSGYAAADLAGAEGRQYPANMRIIRLGCSARFDPHLVLWAFLQGADGVLLGACDPGVCHYVEGNEWAEARVENLRRMLKEAGFDPRRLHLEWFKPDNADAFVEVVKEFTDEIEYLGSTGIR